MAAAQAGEKRGIVARRILSAGQGRYAGVAGQWVGKQGCRCGGGCADGDAVQEVAAGLLKTLGMVVPALIKSTQNLKYYEARGMHAGVFFDAETFGADTA